MSGPEPAVGPRCRSVRVRRGPRVGVFLGLGVAVGLVVALVATLAFPTGGRYSTPQVLGYLAVFGVAGGLVVGGAVAVVLDAISRRRARTVVAQRERIRTAPERPAPAAEAVVTPDPRPEPAEERPEADA